MSQVIDMTHLIQPPPAQEWHKIPIRDILFSWGKWTLRPGTPWNEVEIREGELWGKP